MYIFASKGILRIFGFIVLWLISAAAFAQSAEYHRGYDQGYRDGIEAKSRQDQQGQEGGFVGRILIEEARYGIREASCDIRDELQRAVGWRRNISVTANNELCGDPAPNRVKKLTVMYRCGDGPMLRTQAREGGAVTLHCR